MWRQILGVLVGLGLLLTAAPPLRAQSEPELFAAFDARSLTLGDTRLIQAALTMVGQYHGQLDGAWGGHSQAAFERYAATEFDSPPLNLHAASLVLEFWDEVEINGWTQQQLPELGLSLALPVALLGAPETEENLLRWRGTGGLKVTAARQSAADAVLWHSAGVLGNTRPDEFYTLRQPERLITAGAFADGQRFYARSDLIADGWSTILIVAPEPEASLLNLVSASIAAGAPQDWAPTEHGRLGELVALTLTMIGLSDPDAAAVPHATSIAPPESDGLRSGTGFYVTPETLVTAQHVVENCANVTLIDGTPLEVTARDIVLDLAILRAPVAAVAWLAPDLGAAPRLGQRVFALGFPYFSLTGTGLNVTGGNVSALAGFQDDQRFVTISAPVQPGNSGGPLLDAHGRVLGVIVSRLNEDYIVAETGTMPQNVNYAVSNAELVAFLRRSGADILRTGLGGFSLDDGAPTDIERAVVPLVCE